MKIGYFNAVLSSQGVPILATITVYLVGTSTKPTIYADFRGAAVKDNPFQTDSYGRFQFFADVGFYDIEVSGTGITTYKLEDSFIGSPVMVADIVSDNAGMVADDGELVWSLDY